ncbi:MFS transporter [Lacticaseibacillus sp. 866-1]|uniref:MFS transporter n=1 Tax=Lacticaseibacillus sp. 866-1 TaxID=2799576 RepID=UPI0019446642|nr:MFS transporter [Lacticaseibacillus sp. 866-1]
MKNLTPQTIKMLVLKFAGTFGSSMLSFAIGLYILHRTGSALSMGVTLVTGPVVSLLLTPFVGYVVDTMSHRRIMLSAQVVTSAALVAFGVVFKLWPAQYYAELIALIIVLQVTDNFLSTTLTASLVQLFEGSELQRVNSLNQSITSLAAFLAPLIGAWLYTLVAIDTFAYIEVLFELTALVAILLLKFRLVPPLTTPQPRESVLNNFKTGFAYVKSQKLILTVMISSAAVNFLFAAMNVGLPYLLIQTLKLSNQQYGLVDSGFAVGMFSGGILLAAITIRTHPIRFSYFNLFLLGAMFTTTGLPALFSWPSWLSTAFFWLQSMLNGVLMVLINTPANTFKQRIIPQNLQGRVFSLDLTISTLLAPIGTLVFGALFDHFAAPLLFGIAGSGLLLLTLVVTTVISRQHLLDRPENQVPEDTHD